MNGNLLRRVMREYPTGVAIVAAKEPHTAPYGFTAGSLTSVSLEPPITSVCLSFDLSGYALFRRASHFGVSILQADQEDVARTFSQRDRPGRFHDTNWRYGPYGSPILEECAGWLEIGILSWHLAGDHSILLGRPVAGEAKGSNESGCLVFYGGCFRALSPAVLSRVD